MNLKTIYSICAGCLLAAATFSSSAADAADTNAPPKWDTSASLAFTLTSGNSESMALAANILSVRKWEKNEVALGADGVYGESETEINGEDVKTRNAAMIHGFGQYNRLFTERFFGWFRVDALNDAEADIDYRVSLALGAGYYLIKQTNLTLAVEAGPGYVFEKLNGVTDDYATLRLAERGEWKIGSRVRLWESLEYVPQLEDFGNYVVTGEIGLDTAITKKLSQVTYLQDTYRSEPAPGREHNDLKLMAGLKYKF